MKKSVISWGLVCILGLAVLFLSAYAANTSSKAQQLEESVALTYYLDEFMTIQRYGSMFELMQRDPSAFEHLIGGGETLPLINPPSHSFTVLGEETALALSGFQIEMDLAMLSYIDSSSAEEQETLAADFESAFTRYRELFDQLAQDSPYCSTEEELNVFCPSI